MGTDNRCNTCRKFKAWPELVPVRGGGYICIGCMKQDPAQVSEKYTKPEVKSVKKKYTIKVIDGNGEIVHQSVIGVENADQLAKHIHAVARAVSNLSFDEDEKVSKAANN